METITKSSEETKKFGREVADNLVNSEWWIVDRERSTHHTPNTKLASILALTGDLGSGKTTFVQGLAKGLGIKHRIISPTFIIMRKYRIKLKSKELRLKDFYHIDLYRLQKNVQDEVSSLGIDEIWKDPKNIVAIEWAEKIKDQIPKSAMWIKFENLGGDGRRILVN